MILVLYARIIKLKKDGQINMQIAVDMGNISTKMGFINPQKKFIFIESSNPGAGWKHYQRYLPSILFSPSINPKKLQAMDKALSSYLGDLEGIDGVVVKDILKNDFLTIEDYHKTNVEILVHFFKYLSDLIPSIILKKGFDLILCLSVDTPTQTRKVLQAAAKEAGLPLKFLFDDAMAAVFAYFFNNELPAEKSTIVCDAGGGGLKLSHFSAENNGNFDLLHFERDNYLGAELISEGIADALIKQKRQDFQDRESLKDRLKNAIKLKALFHLGENETYQAFSYKDKKERVSFETFLNNDKIVDLTDNFMPRLEERISGFIKRAQLPPNSKCNVILVGGGCKLPLMASKIKDTFKANLAHVSLFDSKDTRETIVTGTAFYALSALGSDDSRLPVKFRKCYNLSLGIGNEQEQAVIIPYEMIPDKEGGSFSQERYFKVITEGVKEQDLLMLKVFFGNAPTTEGNILICSYPLDLKKSGVTNEDHIKLNLEITRQSGTHPLKAILRILSSEGKVVLEMNLSLPEIQYPGENY